MDLVVFHLVVALLGDDHGERLKNVRDPRSDVCIA